MKRDLHFTLLGVVLLGLTANASASPATWCTKAYDVSSYDLRELSSKDGQVVLPILARAACSSTPEVEAQRADLEKARAAWGAAYGMEDADWADMLALIEVTSYSFKADFSTKSLAEFTPIDQYARSRSRFRWRAGTRSPTRCTWPMRSTARLPRSGGSRSSSTA